MSRHELSLISQTIASRMRDDPSFKVSELPVLLELLGRPKIGQIFLVICDDFPAGPWYQLHTRAELNIQQIPPGTFSKPGGLANFNVLVREKRSLAFLRPQGWL
jgi:hypothetical protein